MGASARQAAVLDELAEWWEDLPRIGSRCVLLAVPPRWGRTTVLEEFTAAVDAEDAVSIAVRIDGASLPGAAVCRRGCCGTWWRRRGSGGGWPNCWVPTGWAARSTEAENILNDVADPENQWAAQLAELRGEANKTAQTIRMTMSRALAFLADPALATAVLPLPGESLDLGSFLYESGSLYLIAESRGEDAPVAPLFACLASELHYTAALLGSQMPGGRLDPPLLMALDEVTQICPVPLPSWLADSGGKGIQIITVAHGEAQLRERWGRDGARIIMDTSGAKIWLPGISDTATLESASALCGTSAMREHGQDHHTRHPVITVEMIRQLPAGRALVVRGGCSPAIARLPMCWKDRTYRSARRAGRAVAPLMPAPGVVALPPCGSCGSRAGRARSPVRGGHARRCHQRRGRRPGLAVG